jgi:hypothetical protein
MNSSSKRASHIRVLPPAHSDEGQIVDDARCDETAQVLRRTRRSLLETIGWPLFAGAALVITLVVVFLVLDLVDGNLASVVEGHMNLWQHVEFRSATIVALLTGILVAHPYEEAATQYEFNRLQARFPDTVSEPFQHHLETVDWIRIRCVGLAGALVMTAIVPALYTEPARFLRLETYLMPSVLLDLAMGAALGWIAARMLFAHVVQDRSFDNPY